MKWGRDGSEIWISGISSSLSKDSDVLVCVRVASSC